MRGVECRNSLKILGEKEERGNVKAEKREDTGMGNFVWEGSKAWRELELARDPWHYLPYINDPDPHDSVLAISTGQ